MSEDIRLKEKNKVVIKAIIKEEENNQDKKTESPDEPQNKEIEIKQKKGEHPLINIRKVSNLSDSVINYFLISISLFMYSAYNLGWFDLKNSEKFVVGYYIFAGVSLYIIGILSWYEGKELLFLFDFIFSFFFIILFLKNNIKDMGDGQNEKLEGLFYILFFAFILIIGLSAKEKGIIFIINYAILFVGFVFLFADKFFKANKWIKYVYSYVFIVSAGLLWITGILKLINNGLINKSISILEPTD